MTFREQSLENYVKQAASDASTPGGGSVSGLGAALGNAMAAMTANYTVGKKKFAAVEDEVQGMLATLAPLRERLMQCMEEDAVAFAAVNDAYGLPRDSKTDKAERTKTIQACLKRAMEVPLEIMQLATDSLQLLPRLAIIGNPNLVSDTGVAAIFLEAAVRAAHVNVLINIKFLSDESLCQETTANARILCNKALSLLQETTAGMDKILPKT